jgi:hypothetical protein
MEAYADITAFNLLRILPNPHGPLEIYVRTFGAAFGAALGRGADAFPFGENVTAYMPIRSFSPNTFLA